MREFGQLTTDEIHELGHLQEQQRFVEHMLLHFQDRTRRRLSVPENATIVFNVITQDNVVVMEAE